MKFIITMLCVCFSFSASGACLSASGCDTSGSRIDLRDPYAREDLSGNTYRPGYVLEQQERDAQDQRTRDSWGAQQGKCENGRDYLGRFC